MLISNNGQNPSGEGGAPSQSAAVELYEWFHAAVYAVVCVVLIFTFFLRTAQVSGKSMLDTLQDQDRLMISRFFYTPRRGDIVVITKPNLDNEPLIKRIVATGGQTVDIDFEYGIVYVDGKALDEPYIKEPTNLKLDVQFPVTIPEGSIFVMGDNRNHSRDSRDSSIFTVDERYILGKVILRIMPFAGFGSVY